MVSGRHGPVGAERLIFGWNVLVDGPEFVGRGSLVVLVRSQARGYRLCVEEGVAEGSRRENNIRHLVGSRNV